jgi:MSHA biogenesis protein MshP
MKQTRFACRGFAAIAAIFLVVGLASLGAFLLTMSNTQQLTSAQDVQGTRAYWSARAGLEWGISSINGAVACPTSPTQLTVDNFTVCVSCAAPSYTEGASTVKIFQLTSTARTPQVVACGGTGAVGSVGYIERSVSASIER